MSIGMDSGWFESFIEAYFDSMAACDLPIWRAFRQVDETYPGVALTEESDWNLTWEEVDKLRAQDSGGRFHCHHSIRIRRDGV